MKLEPKHIISYLPYNVYYKRGNNKPVKLKRWDQWFKLGGVKLILRPMSDLTKEIEVNGERFVPISELLDFSLSTEWRNTGYLKYFNSLNEYWVRLEEEPSWFFGYNKERFMFFLINCSNESQMIDNQYQLFEKFFQWHFDVFGLIEEGLAIDMNKSKMG